MKRKRPVLIALVAAAIALAVGTAIWLKQPRTVYYLASDAAFKGEATDIDIAAIRTKLQAYLDSNPGPDGTYQAVRRYFYLLDNVPGATAADVHPFLSHADVRISEMAQSKLRRLELMKAPINLRFTALDGREVDMEKLRGKIVLLDFWATWCVPCVAELPNLKAAYQKFREQGFEVIGISLDRAEDRQKLIDFVKEEDLPWPQHFAGDGHYTTSEISKHFGVVGIPATFLLDQRGMICAINLRGEQLTSNVQKLLGH